MSESMASCAKQQGYKITDAAFKNVSGSPAPFYN
jgi:hypothetical protein